MQDFYYLNQMKLLAILSFLLLPFMMKGQSDLYYRIKVDFTVKEKSNDGKSGLTMGQIYFDKNKKNIVYNVKFPEKVMWVYNDTVMHVVKGNVKEKKTIIPGFVDYSIFNLTLNNSLKDYGLKKSYIFEQKEVMKDQDMVISVWKPKKEFAKVLGNVKVSVKNNRLYGVIIYNPAGQMIGKQIFTEYMQAGGIEFPAEIISYTYNNNIELSKQLITYKNIKINQRDEDYFYNYTVTGH